MPSYVLYMTSYPHFRTKPLILYGITCTIFITSHALYMTSHLLCIVSHSLYVLHHTMTLWHQTLYVYDIFTLYGIKHGVMTTQPLCAFTATMPEITLSVFLTLHTMYQFYEKKWMCVITASICMTPYALQMASHPLFMTSHHLIYDVKSTISNITCTLSDVTSTVSV